MQVRRVSQGGSRGVSLRRLGAGNGALSAFGLVVGAAFLWQGAGAAEGYTIVDLGNLGSAYARGWGINDAGQVVGDSLSTIAGASVRRAFLWDAASGLMSDLGTVGGRTAAAWSINNAGTVCGVSLDVSGRSQATVWSLGAATALPTLGGQGGSASGLNDFGVVVGLANTSSGDAHATLWAGNQATDLGTLGGTYSIAYDINNFGISVGTASNASEVDRAVVWGTSGIRDLGDLSGGTWIAAYAINDSGEMILWGKPAGSSDNRAGFWRADDSSVVALGTLRDDGRGESWAYGLNDDGYVVGDADTFDGYSHAFVWDGLSMTDLGTLPGGGYSRAYGINDSGTIIGWSRNALGETRAVEWVPVPEPGVPLLALLGGCLLVRRRLQRLRS